MSKFRELRTELKVWRVLAGAKMSVRAEIFHSERIIEKISGEAFSDGSPSTITDIEGAKKSIRADLADLVESFEEQIDLLTQAVAYAGRELCDKVDLDIDVFEIPPKGRLCPSCNQGFELEELALKIGGSSYPLYYHKSKCPPKEPDKVKRDPLCTACGQVILSGTPSTVKDGEHFHQGCWKERILSSPTPKGHHCAKCSELINDPMCVMLRPGGDYTYHERCLGRKTTTESHPDNQTEDQRFPKRWETAMTPNLCIVEITGPNDISNQFVTNSLIGDNYVEKLAHAGRIVEAHNKKFGHTGGVGKGECPSKKADKDILDGPVPIGPGD